jgi:Zn-dependent protease
MGWEDRPYYRDRDPSGENPLLRALNGSVPLFTAFGIRVRAHAWLIIYLVSILVFGVGYEGFTFQDRFTAIGITFGIVLLHEFGHCFAARWVGGEAHEILMHPFGGLAFPDPPRNWRAVFITVAGGPLVNVAICALCAVVLLLKVHWLPWNPFVFSPIPAHPYWDLSKVWQWIVYYSAWVYSVSYMILAFNLLPIYPLDGGQMVQAIMWPRVGYYRSMIISTTTGMVGSVAGALVAIVFHNLNLCILAMLGFLNCFNMRRQILAAGPYAFSDEDSPVDYGASLRMTVTSAKREHRAAQKSAARAKKRAEEEAMELAKIDEILAKVSAHGMNSLTWQEKRALKNATEHQRQRDLKAGGSRRG